MPLTKYCVSGKFQNGNTFVAPLIEQAVEVKSACLENFVNSLEGDTALYTSARLKMLEQGIGLKLVEEQTTREEFGCVGYKENKECMWSKKDPNFPTTIFDDIGDWLIRIWG